MKKKLNPYITLIFIGLMTLFVVNSCGNRRHEKPEVKIKNKSDKELRKSLMKQDWVGYDFFTGRIAVDFKNKDQDNSFSVYLKMKVDSAFAGSIKVMGFVVATYMVTQDSVMFTNKTEKCYFAENLNYISSLFGTTIEYDFFQDLLLGLPVGFDEESKYKQLDAEDHYILSTHKERDYKKLENDRLDIEEDLMLIQYHLNPETLMLEQIDLDVPVDSARIQINYADRKLVEGFNIPEETTIQIVHPKDSIFIRMNYGTVKLNDPKSISINIPDSYIECK